MVSKFLFYKISFLGSLKSSPVVFNILSAIRAGFLINKNRVNTDTGGKNVRIKIITIFSSPGVELNRTNKGNKELLI